MADTNATTASYIIVVGPMLYYVCEGHYSRDRKKAMPFPSMEDAKEIASSEYGWKAVKA